MNPGNDSASLIAILSNFGFPIAAVLYLMFRFESRIKGLEDAIYALKSVLCEWRDKSE